MQLYNYSTPYLLSFRLLLVVFFIRVFIRVRMDWFGKRAVCGKVWPVTGLLRDISNKREIAALS